MAKKKTLNDNIEIPQIDQQLIKKYGSIIQSGTEVLKNLEAYNIINVSPSLDLALGGGIREGQCVGMTGDPKTGKTTSALYFAAKAQAKGKKIYYINTEGRLTKHNFKGIKNLNIDDITIIQSTDETPIVSAETYLNVLERLVKEQDDLVAIIDSASNMVPQSEIDGEIRSGVRNELPRLLSMFFKRTSGDIARRKAILLFIMHNIANTSGSKYAPSKMADCGNMIQYQVNTNMIITHRGKWEVPKESGNHVGQVANWQIRTSASGGKPMSVAASWIRYGIGIDETQELAQLASEFAMIGLKGSWYTINTFIENRYEETIKNWLLKHDVNIDDESSVASAFKFQGMENIVNFLNENKDLYDFLNKNIRDMFL